MAGKLISARLNGIQYFRRQFAGMAETGEEDDAAEKEPWEKDYFEVGIDFTTALCMPELGIKDK